jgi:RNA polymerase sigma-70 factor (ECF subfamily)
MLKSSFFQAVALAPQAQRIASPERFVAMPSSDEALVTQSLRGDAQAFAELVTRYTAPIFNLVLRLTNDQAEAENMTQETFLRAYTALPHSRTELAFKPWLFQIAVNLCRDWARKKRPAAFSELAQEAEAAPEEAIEDQSPLPLDQIEESELQRALAHAIGELPDIYRAVVTLRYTEELSYDEIAAVLKLPINTVRTHLFRAKTILRKSLADWQFGD